MRCDPSCAVQSPSQKSELDGIVLVDGVLRCVKYARSFLDLLLPKHFLAQVDDNFFSKNSMSEYWMQ